VVGKFRIWVLTTFSQMHLQEGDSPLDPPFLGLKNSKQLEIFLKSEVVLLARTKDKQVKFWADEKDLQAIRKKVVKSKLSQQEYLLKCALDKEINVIDGLHEMTIELKRIGNNLNQITRAVHEGQANCSNEVGGIQKELSETWQLLRLLIQKQV